MVLQGEWANGDRRYDVTFHVAVVAPQNDVTLSVTISEDFQKDALFVL